MNQNRKRVAVLDLGTNTFHLLIANVGDGKEPQIIAKESVGVKLGEGGITKNRISDEAFFRGLKACHQFHEIIRKFNPDEVMAVGTAALREAENGDSFVERVRTETGISIEIIEGDREAALIYEGVRRAVKIPAAPALIMDIGGGSVEFILCDSSRIYWKQSYPIGAARLMAMFHHSDPISDENVNTIIAFLKEQLTDLKMVSNELTPGLLIGSAGAFETFAELEVLHYHLEPELLKKSGFTFDMEHFYKISGDLLETTHQQRRIMPGLAEIRVDMIIVATIITRYILKELNINRMELSAYSLKEGLLFQKTF